jgi:hypothetical protein
LVGKSGSKKMPGSPRIRWDYRIKIYFKEKRGHVDWIHLDKSQWRPPEGIIMNTGDH